jgi:TolB protein
VFALEDDPDLRAAADAWETWLDAHDLDELNGVGALATPGPMLWRRASLPLDPTGATLRGLVTDGRVIRSLIVAEAGSAHQEFPPTPAEHQALLQTIVEPALEAAIDALHRVDDSAFTFEVTPAMQGENEGEADPLELDRTEVLVLQAALEAALAGLDIATAYRAEPSPWGADGFAQAMEPGSTFATLADDGAVRLADAHQRLGTAVSLLRDALDFLVAESDNQDDDVIKYDPAAPGGGYDDLDDYVGSDDVADARELLDELEGALAGPTVVTVDLGQGEMDLEVDLTEFFLDPIPDLKALLPTYDASGGRFRWTAATFEEWIFPDPTFDGVLPGMGSTAQLKATIELGDLYEEFAPDTIGQDPGQIAFVSRPTASTLADLHLIRADGTERRQLTDFPAPRPGQKREVVASAATWSPARDRLFMATWVDTLTYDHSTLSLVNVDGTGLSRILDYGSEPSWAPDGTRVAFMGLAPGGWDIFVMDADGTNVINITKTAEVTEGNPAWSPTGATIAYDAAGQSLGAAGIYVMNADGTGATLLTDHDMRDMEPAWSPDGTRIAFVRWKDPSGASYDPDIWVMNADGTDMTPVFEPETTEGSPSWSPEGTGIAFNMNRDDITPSISGQYPHIWIINPDGSGLRQVTSGYSNNTAPTWRPE